MRTLGVAGAICGIVAFAALEPFIDENAAVGGAEALARMSRLFAIFGLILSFGLTVAEEMDSARARRIANYGIKAVVAGAIGGFAAGYLAQQVYTFLGPLESFGLAGQIVRRSVGWAILGAIVGAASGMAAGSWKKAALGLIGGLVGGGIGGFMFDIVANPLQYGGLSRLAGFTCVGLGTGLAVALMQELAKQAWIVVLSGRNEGREYILTKRITNIGRDELADVPLFGDTSVAKLHATVEAGPGGYLFCDAAGGSTVNNQAAPQKTLADGDTIRIGRFSLSFRTRGAPRSATPPGRQTLPQTPSLMPRLKVTAGPYAGRAFDVVVSPISIGRDATNNLALDQDPRVSRGHATLTYENGQYVLRDAGSTNGTFVNNTRVTERVLNAGDTIQVGGTTMILVFEGQ
ncbi:MAG: FHA domain-containing protein [Armatimonadota bacterium]|nr:FHA domain-containing protein [Armatimonadota bacterium]